MNFLFNTHLVMDAGYTVRHLHDTRVDKRLESIEKTVSTVQKVVDILASKSCIPCNKDYFVRFF